MKTIKLYSFDNLQEAHLVMGNLKNQGIDCFVQNENLGTLAPHYSNIFSSGIDLIISSEDFEKAEKILIESGYIQDKTVVCPNCKSTNVSFQFADNKLKFYFFAFLSAISFIPLGNLKRKMICLDCKTKF